MRSKSSFDGASVARAACCAVAVLLVPIGAFAQGVPTYHSPPPLPAPVAEPGAEVLQKLTLAEALSRAETANPMLRGRQAQLDAAQGTRTDASGWLFNNPELSGSTTRRKNTPSSVTDERWREWDAGISQRFEIAGQHGYRRNEADAALSAVEAEIIEARRMARVEAAERFYRVLALQERVALEAEAAKLFDDTAGAIQKRRVAGEDTKLDANIAAVEAERARNQLAVSTEDLIAARSDLAATLQLPGDRLPEAVGELSRSPRRYTLAELQSSVDGQPKLRALAYREESASARLKLEQASVYPDVTVGVTVGREGAYSSRERLTMLTLSVPLPLFKRNASGIGQARTELSRSQIERESTLRDSRAAVQALWVRLQSLDARIQRLQKTMLPSLVDNQQLSVKSQQAGQIGLLELIVVNRQAIDARRDLNDALIQYHATRLELEFAAGLATEATQP